MALRAEFQRELSNVHKLLIKMGMIIEQSIDDTIKALKTQNSNLAEEVIKRDDKINEMEKNIEQECLRIIARQSPIAGDLREIASVLKIITDLERIADHCADISKYSLKLSKDQYVKPVIHIPEMSEIVKEMVKHTIDSYVEKDIELATKVCETDDKVDKLFYQIVNELQLKMKESPDYVSQCVDFIFIVKYLEKMADHATNIADWIIYDVTGKHSIYG